MNREKIETAANEITSSFEEANIFIKGAEWANQNADDDTFDGCHTMGELYRFRLLYNAAMFNMLAKYLPSIKVVKSKRHDDGEECFGGGWFIVQAQLPNGQISNHYELKDWDLFDVPEVERADKWDGHTPQDVAERLEEFCKKRFVKLSEPKLRPYASMQEFLQAEKEHGPWLICKKPNEFLSHEAVKAIYADSCDIIVREHVTLRYNYSGLTERFEWQDGTPCGVLERGVSRL